MANEVAIWVLAVAALLQTCTGSVIQDPARRQLSRHRFSHLQVEVDEWVRLGKPTQAEFPHNATHSAAALLVDLPDQPVLRGTDYVSNVLFYFYSRESPDGAQVIPDAASLTKAGWTPLRPTKIVIHGFSNNINSDVFRILVPDLLLNGDYNVVGVDWGSLSEAPFYIEARSHVSGVASRVAALVDGLVLDAGMDIGTVHLLGHSLGAHVAGTTGKKVQTGTIGRITGMDPAMPLFLLLKSDRLAKGDATLVDVVHTCGGMLGLEDAIGDVDFYVNGGSRAQPGCGIDLTGACSHGRSYEYVGESATEADSFAASECASASSAADGDCSDQTDANMGVDLKFNPNGTGTYFVQTAGSSPFDMKVHRRMDGSK